MTNSRLDIAVIGAGIVGLATAMELVMHRPGLRVAVLEKEDRVAAHQTGRNSGVIHAGLYYKPGSLKASMAAQGALLMVEFCQEQGVPYELCGKVIVATSEAELPRLEELHRRGTANGVKGLRRITAEEIREYEPHAVGIAGIHSPHTGIADYTEVARASARIVEQGGGELRFNTRVTSLLPMANEWVLLTPQGELRARALVNCAGLQSDLVARMAGSTHGVRIVPFRGEYYELAPAGRALVRSLIYPVPDPAFPFLGVHFTKRINGKVEAGPNAVLAFAREGYRKTSLSASHLAGLLAFPGFYAMAARYWRMGLGEIYRSWHKRAFVGALRKLVPELGTNDIRAGGAGVRAQAMDRKGNLLDDFSIIEMRNAIHVLNAPSPAATASIPIGRHIADRALAAFTLGR